MFAAILGSLVMGTLASKVGENIVGKRLGMSEKDRKLLGTVFGMAGGAYGGYAGSAGFGSSGIGASGSAGGMGGQSPKVGGDYGTAVDLYSQPTATAGITGPGAGPGYYGSAPVGNVANTGYQYMPAMGTEYTPIDGYTNQYNEMANMPAESYGMDSFRINDYDRMASMPAESYGMDMYADKSVYKGPDWFDNALVPEPTYQGPSSGNVSAQTYALDTPSRTIDLAPAGDPNAVFQNAGDVVNQTQYDLMASGDPSIDVLGQVEQVNSNNLSMSDGFSTSTGDEIRLIQENADGTFTEIGAPSDLSTSQGVEDFINMDQIRIDEMPGGPLDPFGTGPNITAANYSVSGPPQSVGSYNGPIIDNSLNADPRSLYQNTPQSAFVEAPVDSVGRPILGKTIAQDQYLAATGGDSRVIEAVSQSTGDYYTPRATGVNTPPKGVKVGPKGDLSVKLKDVGVDIKDAPMTNKAIDEIMSKPREYELNTRAIENETQNIAEAMKYEIPPSRLDKLLSKIPDSVKQWAAETGIALLDMWIKQTLFGQDYDDQIAESGGGGGGGVLRGTSPMVSPYSGGGSGGGGKGVLFSMGGGGQQGRGTHIMALQ